MPTIDIVATGRTIDSLMRQNNMTVNDVVKIMGFGSKTSVYKWINGISIPSIDSIIILAHIFHVTIDDIIQINVA